mmetsp:Transcript_103366/g.291845  ORF Transcript_103366/g.291845 Transcript_103366/m.291845 type:complete len:236 (-) Transcript_103366:1014-1721(-)
MLGSAARHSSARARRVGREFTSVQGTASGRADALRQVVQRPHPGPAEGAHACVPPRWPWALAALVPVALRLQLRAMVRPPRARISERVGAAVGLVALGRLVAELATRGISQRGSGARRCRGGAAWQRQERRRAPRRAEHGQGRRGTQLDGLRGLEGLGQRHEAAEHARPGGCRDGDVGFRCARRARPGSEGQADYSDSSADVPHCLHLWRRDAGGAGQGVDTEAPPPRACRPGAQ